MSRFNLLGFDTELDPPSPENDGKFFPDKCACPHACTASIYTWILDAFRFHAIKPFPFKTYPDTMSFSCYALSIVYPGHEFMMKLK